MISIAVNTVFFLVLGFTMQAQNPKEPPQQQPEIKQEEVIKEQPAPTPAKIETPAPALKPAL